MLGEKRLNDRKCKNARARRAIYYLSDGKGLRLQVRPNGAKYWMLRYYLGGVENTLGLGVYPETSLKEARDEADDARKLVSRGSNPSQARRIRVAQSVERGRTTFRGVAEEWLDRHRPLWSAAHHERNEGLLRRILYPELAALPVADIDEATMLRVLRKAYDGGIKESARRAGAIAAQVFRYAKDTHRATTNPARELNRSSLLKKPEVKHFAALRASEVRLLFKQFKDGPGESITKAALLLMLYTGLRDFSVRGARWKEIDLNNAVWTVPAERMKGGKLHRVSLPRQALSALRQLQRGSDSGPETFVFASYGQNGFLAENTLRMALHRMGFKVTAHGFRSLITDVLNESGWSADAVDRQLDHVIKDKVRRAYLRGDFFEYRRKMMQWFADWCDAQKRGTKLPRLPSHLGNLRAVS